MFYGPEYAPIRQKRRAPAIEDGRSRRGSLHSCAGDTASAWGRYIEKSPMGLPNGSRKNAK